MRFSLLGPLVVADGMGNRAVLAGPRLRVMLAALLLHANVQVPTGELAELVWDGTPPAGAVATLRSYAARLRRALGSDPARIVAQYPGYLIRVERQELDVLEFEALCADARAALRAGQWADTSAAAARALGLWRAAPLLDIPSEALRGEFAPRLERLRLQALEDGFDAGLRLGRYQELAQHLLDVTARYPLQERFHAQLMLALAAAGRRAQALDAYQRARRVLIDELGIEPGPELRAVHQRILAAGGQTAPPADATPAREAPGTADEDAATVRVLDRSPHTAGHAAVLLQPAREPAALARPRRPGRRRRLRERILTLGEAEPAASASTEEPATSAGAHAPRPRQLPAAPAHFTGHDAELEWLTGLPERGEPTEAGDTVVISAIDGMAGIGKTALAVHAARRLSERFPDGQLFIDLHGYTKGQQAREPGQALEAFLRALGVPAGQIPQEVEERAALYRQRLAGTRTLILLDNASDEAQLRPLLPGEPGCLVLVTSRRRLKGLDDARSLTLDLLPPHDAVALLRAVAGAERIAAGDPLAGEIAGLCGRLPLALRIGGALLRHRPAWSLEHLAGLLRDLQHRVRALSDGERDLAAVFDLSYAGLDEPHRLLFRRLGLVPGPDADAYAAAALLECDPNGATALLEDLVDHNLLIEHALGRYRLHDLLRAHARTLAETGPAGRSREALDRLLRYYARTAQRASIPIAHAPRPEPYGPAPPHAPALQDPEAARAWLRTEYPNLEAAFTHARTDTPALDEHITALAAGLAEILLSDGPWTRALEIHQAAAEVAGHRHQPAAHATALTDLGQVRHRTGDLAGAADALERALETCRETGNRLSEAHALTSLGQLRHQTGDLAGAADALERALETFRETGNRLSEAHALTSLGQVRHQTGDLAGAADALERALETSRETGNRLSEAWALAILGQVRHRTGDLAGAADALERALETCRETGSRDGEAWILTSLGEVRHRTGDLAGAADAVVRAIETFRDIGNRNGEAHALAIFGQVRHRTGDLAGAADALERALETCRETGNRNSEAWALNHYAATLAALGERSRALTRYQQALAMTRELNKPDDEAIALEGLGECHLATSQDELAAAHLEQALDIFQRLGMAPDAERVHNRLAGLAKAGNRHLAR
jgi:DNA-binding SARP family transcriptional activator/Tfp pilus assembly protein PilF